MEEQEQKMRVQVGFPDGQTEVIEVIDANLSDGVLYLDQGDRSIIFSPTGWSSLVVPRRGGQ